MSKEEELKRWHDRLVELKSKVIEQIDWLESNNVVPEKKQTSLTKLDGVADRLIEIQKMRGEYTREDIDAKDVDKIKDYAKKYKLGFEDVINLLVKNNRYLSKERIEARGVAIFAKDIYRVYENYYAINNVFPINAMSAESKRSCRNLKNGISLTDKVETIVDVFFPDYKGMKIAERDYSVIPQSKEELSQNEIESLKNYLYSFEKNGKIDDCFDEQNKDQLMDGLKLLARTNLTLDDFLLRYTNLTYTKCYSLNTVPAVKQMASRYFEEYETTRYISTDDTYLRNKLETAQKIVGDYTIRGFLEKIGVKSDNDSTENKVLDQKAINTRCAKLFFNLENVYPKKVIAENFIVKYLDLYEETKFLASRCGYRFIDEFLASAGFKRDRSYNSIQDSRVYLSENDLNFYKFDMTNYDLMSDCDLVELDPRNYFDTYNKLIFHKKDYRQILGDSASKAKENGDE